MLNWICGFDQVLHIEILTRTTTLCSFIYKTYCELIQNNGLAQDRHMSDVISVTYMYKVSTTCIRNHCSPDEVNFFTDLLMRSFFTLVS